MGSPSRNVQYHPPRLSEDRPLRVPDDPAARARFPGRPDPPQRLVHGDELLVAGQLADGPATVDLEHDEVAHDIEDVTRLEEPVEQDVLGRRRASEFLAELVHAPRCWSLSNSSPAGSRRGGQHGSTR